ncbi:hypothetical protein [Vibrio ziniensis]|uniref:Sulfotransferase family protein n=1 Tax=Vibrio ziniensis TaxID=2711221 RepID=A0A6G7CMG6_9VIBR|nr:hypothetical protein [Vibrio ziniensis]QIH43299.1 hypothetical protein G5S32_14935 [Vibrio ziniensis]
MIKSLLRYPKLIIPSQHIFLISHMRANTTLLGHLLGSSDEISGYYEMHTGYYSWKSLLKQKIMFHSANSKEVPTKFYFDKILHSEHYLNETILNRENCSFIFMLRSPERTIKSICKLYRNLEPKHEFAQVEGATNYYTKRVSDIGNIICNIKDTNKITYIDAECLVNKTNESLEFLTNRIGLKSKLKSEYKKFELTGKKNYGDSSSKIDIGHVSKSDNSYDDIELESDLIKDVEDIYVRVRDELIRKSQFSLII